MLCKTASWKKEKMPVNCHLKFRIIPPETAHNDPLAVSHKPQVLKLVWDEQRRGECCNGFNIIPKVIWWDFHPVVRNARHRAAVLIPIAHSHCSVQGASCSLSISFNRTRFEMAQTPGMVCQEFFRLLSFPHFRHSASCMQLTNTFSPLLVHTSSALMSARCHSFKGFFCCCLFLNYMAFFTSLGVFSSSF